MIIRVHLLEISENICKPSDHVEESLGDLCQSLKLSRNLRKGLGDLQTVLKIFR